MARFWCSEADSSASASLADACSMISFSNPSAARRKTVSARPSCIGRPQSAVGNVGAVQCIIPCGTGSSLLLDRFRPSPSLLGYQYCSSNIMNRILTIVHNMSCSSHSLLYCLLSDLCSIAYNNSLTNMPQAPPEQSSTCSSRLQPCHSPILRSVS